MEDVLLLWHAGLVPTYRDRYRALEKHFGKVTLVVPAGWREAKQHRGAADRLNVDVELVPSYLNVRAETLVTSGLGRVLDRTDPEIFYVHEEPFSLIAFQAIAAAAGEGPTIVLESSLVSKKGTLGGWNPLEDHVYRAVDTVLFRNEDTKRTLIERGCPPDKLRGPVPNGVSLDRFRERSEESVRNALAEWGLEDLAGTDDLVVGFAGQIRRGKGIETLLRIAASPDVEVVACGRPVEDVSIERVRSSRHVNYLGELAPGEMSTFYSAVDVLILPSVPERRWKEQFGRVLTEAIACGTPAIGSDVGMVSEIVGEQWDFCPGDWIAATELLMRLERRETRARVVAEQMRRVRERYTWDAVVQRVSEWIT